MRKLLVAAAVLGILVGPVSGSAQTRAEPIACVATVSRLQDNVSLRLQQYNGQENRERIKAMLQAAANAASAGNEDLCWAYLKRSQQIP